MKITVEETRLRLYSDSGEVINASMYQKIIKQDTFEGKSERLGLPEVIADNGDRINVKVDGDDLYFETLSGEPLYLSPRE